MAEGAKWIKITTDIFEDEKIDIIEGKPEGYKIIITWFKLLLLAGKCNAGGYLLLQEDIPFTKEMLARVFKMDINIIELSFKEFERYKMIQMTPEGIYITNFNKYQDLDKLNQKRAQDRERKRKQREKDKMLMEAAVSEADPQEENHMSPVTSQKNQCDNVRDSSYSASASYSDSNSNNSLVHNSNYIKFFNDNIHRITEYEAKILASYEQKGMSPQVITLALKEAAEENAKRLSYVKKILDRWLENKIFSVEDVKADKEAFERRKKSAKEENKKTKGKTSTFNDFNQRDYDYDYLEKQLLGWEKAGSCVS